MKMPTVWKFVDCMRQVKKHIQCLITGCVIYLTPVEKSWQKMCKKLTYAERSVPKKSKRKTDNNDNSSLLGNYCTLRK
jgi:hypothetical protein